MKHTAYIIVIAIIGIFTCAETVFVYQDQKQITFLSGNASYWKGKYDSAKMIWLNQYWISYNKDSIWYYTKNNDTVINVFSTSFKDLYKHLPEDTISSHPVRHARHRGEKPYHYKHDEDSNDWNFPDYLLHDTIHIIHGDSIDWSHSAIDSDPESTTDSIGSKYTTYKGKPIRQEDKFVIQIYNSNGLEQETFYNGYLIRLELWYNGNKVDNEYFHKPIDYFKVEPYYSDIHHNKN